MMHQTTGSFVLFRNALIAFADPSIFLMKVFPFHKVYTDLGDVLQSSEIVDCQNLMKRKREKFQDVEC